MFGVEFGVIAFLLLIIWVYAIIKIIGSKASALAKAIWIAIVFFFPVGGFILWFLFGPKR